MGGKSKIEWTDVTWNPVTGCSKVSPGCAHCYAERVFPRAYPGRKFTGVQTHQERLAQPLAWKRPRMVFVNSMSDLFHGRVPDEFIDQVFNVMAIARQHTFQVLTKRAERMWEYVNNKSMSEWPLPNVWLGVSIESMAYINRLQQLLECPATVRFVSAEPLLGDLDLGLRNWAQIQRDDCRLDWVIVGGESGPKARPMHPDWVRAIRQDCEIGGVPFFFKQWGEWLPMDEYDYHRLGRIEAWKEQLLYPRAFTLTEELVPEERPLPTTMVRVGKRLAGRKLDGREWNEMPTREPCES